MDIKGIWTKSWTPASRTLALCNMQEILQKLPSRLTGRDLYKQTLSCIPQTNNKWLRWSELAVEDLLTGIFCWACNCSGTIVHALSWPPVCSMTNKNPLSISMSWNQINNCTKHPDNAASWNCTACMQPNFTTALTTALQSNRQHLSPNEIQQNSVWH